MVILTADIGNTNITLGIYENGRLKTVTRLETDCSRKPDEYGGDLLRILQERRIPAEIVEAFVIASVVPEVTLSLGAGASRYLGREPFLVDKNIRTGIIIKTDAPEQVGADRIVNAAAAFRFYGGPCLVIDFGTATTYDVVTENGEFLGGIIAPGVKICAEALWRRTAKLPRIEIKKPDRIMGTNTVSSMQSGVFYGYLGEVEFFIRKLKEELGLEFTTIATGGLSNLFRDSTNAIDLFDEHLTMSGLYYLYQLNLPVRCRQA